MAHTARRPVHLRPTSPIYQAPRSRVHDYRNKILIVISLTAIYTAYYYQQPSGGARAYLTDKTTMRINTKRLQIATWNIAAINNNPFEYWLSVPGKEYERLMAAVEDFIEKPGDKDVPVQHVFTPAMFQQLDKKMTAVGWPSVQSYYDNDYSKRTIVNGFLKDAIIGSKRLVSMPDRVTNTINLADGSVAFRPTVTNQFEEQWSWQAWEAYMFENSLKVQGKTSVEEKKPYQMLQPIKKAKYPDISEQEEADSLPLQTMCCAIFDSILIHMMNNLSSDWLDIKNTITKALVKGKAASTLRILEEQYAAESDVITLQEVSFSLIAQARRGKLGQLFHILAPSDYDESRDQNSVVCLSKKRFPNGMESEITHLVTSAFPQGAKVPVAKGDILAVTAKSVEGTKYVVASFHGDTNGLATVPVLDAIMKAMSDNGLADRQLIFGLDANAYEHATPGKQLDVVQWADHFTSAHGLTSCWGDKAQPSNYTTYNARTYLQPQLNKACRQSEKRSKGDVNPKDFILFPKSRFHVIKTWKDNTGKKNYVEDMAFPTLDFPSDHGILATIVESN